MDAILGAAVSGGSLGLRAKRDLLALFVVEKCGFAVWV